MNGISKPTAGWHAAAWTILLAGTVMLTGGCADGDTSPASLAAGLWGQAPGSGQEEEELQMQEPPGKADLNAYLAGLPSWDEFSPQAADHEGPTGDPVRSVQTVGNQNYQCTSTPYSLTRTPDRIATLNPDVDVLWAGALLQGRGYVGGIGSLAELPVRQRAPLKLSLDLLSANNSIVVENPSQSSVITAIGQLVSAADATGHRAGSRISFNEVAYHSLAEASVQAGLSALYQGATVKATLEASVSAETSTLFAVYTQQMFTVSIEQPQTPGEMFSDAFTQARLDEQIAGGRIGPGNLPVYVSSIVYGRTLVFSMTATGTQAEIRAALSIAAGKQGGELSDRQKLLLSTSEVRLIAVGGDAQNAADVIRSGELAHYFDQAAPLTTAHPISYTVRNLADSSIARVSETTDYDVRQCAEASIPVTGAMYRIKMVDATYVDRGPLRSCAGLSNGVGLGVHHFHVNSQDLVLKQIFLGPTLTISQVYPFDSKEIDVPLHYDGRDEVTLGGYIRGMAFPSTRSLDWNWNPPIRFKGNLPEGYRTTSAWGLKNALQQCGLLRVRYHVTRGADLND